MIFEREIRLGVFNIRDNVFEKSVQLVLASYTS